MEEISTSVSESIGLLVWSDWLIMVALLVFVGLGVKRGLLVELINLSFLALAVLVACVFHESLSHLAIIQWIFSAHQLQLFVTFSVIFVVVLTLRSTFYQLVTTLSAINNPCVFNKFFALLVLFILNFFVSWHHVSFMADSGLITYFIVNDALRIEVSFVLLFAMMTGIVLLLKQAFSISFSASEPCFFEPLFRVILSVLQNVNTALDVSNTSPMKKTGGAVVGFIKGCVLILMVILVLQSIEFIAKQNFWLESQHSLKTFQALATGIRSELAEHLLFINKD